AELPEVYSWAILFRNALLTWDKQEDNNTSATAQDKVTDNGDTAQGEVTGTSNTTQNQVMDMALFKERGLLETGMEAYLVRSNTQEGMSVCEGETRHLFDSIFYRMFPFHEIASPHVLLERTLSLPKHMLFEKPGSSNMASLVKKRIARHNIFLQSIFEHIIGLDDSTKADLEKEASEATYNSHNTGDFDDKIAKIFLDYAHDEPRTAKADAIFALTSSFGQDEKSGGGRSLDVVTINSLAVVHVRSTPTTPPRGQVTKVVSGRAQGSNSPDGGHAFGEKSESKQDAGQKSWKKIQERLERIRIKTQTDPFSTKKMEGLDTANIKRHEQKNLIIPFCVVENKKSEHSVMQAINQVKLYSVSVAQFLAELKVYDFPIFGIATYGTKALVLLTWHSKAEPEPKPKTKAITEIKTETTGEEEEETDTKTFIFDRKLEEFDIAEPHGLVHFITFLARVRDIAEEQSQKPEIMDLGKTFYSAAKDPNSSLYQWTMAAQFPPKERNTASKLVDGNTAGNTASKAITRASSRLREEAGRGGIDKK
ncbi:hypothetical protein H0H87_004936, partial [Tephrocybe sp. NHM501043]